MAEAAKDPAGASDSETTPMPKASLSQRAEELAARLEAHKLQAKSEADREAARKAAVKAAISGQAPAAPAAAPAKTTTQPTVKPKPKASTPKPESKAEPARTAAQPVVEPKGEVEDVIRAIKLPHEIQAEKPKPATDKPAAAKPAAAKPAAAKPTASKPEQNPAKSAAKAAPPEASPRAQVPPVSVAPAAEPGTSSAAAVAQARSRVFGNHVEDKPSEAAIKRRVARERALTSKPALGRAAQIVAAIVFPVVLLIAAIRLIATPAFLALAYARPGFPEDLFGFSAAQRLVYGSYGVDYLNNFAGPEYLSGLRMETGSAMFTEAEVQHMVDVKNLIGVAYVLGAVLAVVLIICLWYLAKRYAGGVRRALFSGALVTLALIATLTTLAVMGWETFFSDFHALFFSDGTWTFSVRDTLIRLYPEQFWIDSAIAIAALVLITVVVVLVTCWPTGRRREASRLRQEARAFGLGNN